MNITERVFEKLKELGMTQVELCDATGITKSTMNYILTNNKKFEADYIIPIANKLGVTVSWLLTGDENSVDKEVFIKEVEAPLPEDVKELIKIYRSLDMEGRTMVLATAYKHRARVNALAEEKKADNTTSEPA